MAALDCFQKAADHAANPHDKAAAFYWRGLVHLVVYRDNRRALPEMNAAIVADDTYWMACDARGSILAALGEQRDLMIRSWQLAYRHCDQRDKRAGIANKLRQYGIDPDQGD